MRIDRPKVYWKLIIAIVLASLLIVFIISYNVNPDKDVRPQREFEGGKLYKAGNISVLQLSGSYKEMGRQYCGLLKDEIQGFYTIVIDEHYIKDKGLKYGELNGISEATYDRYSEKFKALMAGINEENSEKQPVTHSTLSKYDKERGYGEPRRFCVTGTLQEYQKTWRPAG